MIKTNFGDKKKSNELDKNKPDTTEGEGKDLTKEEWEKFIIKSGAKGSFMIYRSNKKDDELGLDEI